jgi:hypothetical protein
MNNRQGSQKRNFRNCDKDKNQDSHVSHIQSNEPIALAYQSAADYLVR